MRDAEGLVSVGKLPPDDLKKFLSEIYTPKPGILVGPEVGEDYAAFEVDGYAVVVHSDPITGAGANAGWLSVHVACNDVATSGADPRWLIVTLLARAGTTMERLSELARQIRSAADEVGASVIGGHTETTPWLDRDIIVTTALGVVRANRLIRSSGAKPGDLAVMTKTAAIEGTAVLATDLYDRLSTVLPHALLERAKGLIESISVVPEARISAEHRVHAMHDPTEGGIAAGLQEVAMASGVGIVAREEDIPMLDETRKICEALGVDPLKLISSGTLLIAAPPESVDELLEDLRNAGIRASVIGEFTDNPSVREIERLDGSKLNLNEPIKEELWRIVG
ncbi:MAG TPA: AIR synthase [Candidatus Korarchaeota archaeon]|nr:AIR synthase [Candidatus Korarchaeota archaeon]